MKCEACGQRGDDFQVIYISTTNGGLFLCRQCLDDVNRKNPDLLRLRGIMIRLHLDPDRCGQFPKGEQCGLKAGHEGPCKWGSGD